jgi:hypothetical protein
VSQCPGCGKDAHAVGDHRAALFAKLVKLFVGGEGFASEPLAQPLKFALRPIVSPAGFVPGRIGGGDNELAVAYSVFAVSVISNETFWAWATLCSLLK